MSPPFYPCSDLKFEGVSFISLQQSSFTVRSCVLVKLRPDLSAHVVLRLAEKGSVFQKSIALAEKRNFRKSVGWAKLIFAIYILHLVRSYNALECFPSLPSRLSFCDAGQTRRLLVIFGQIVPDRKRWARALRMSKCGEKSDMAKNLYFRPSRSSRCCAPPSIKFCPLQSLSNRTRYFKS